MVVEQYVIVQKTVEFLFLKSAPNKVQKKPVCFSEASETAKAKNNSTEQLSLLPSQTLNRQNVFRKLTFQNYRNIF